MADAHAHEPKIHVFHGTAPTCFWSWGYEALFNRLHLVYGDQIGVHLMTLCVYDGYDEYLKHYELTFDGLVDWYKEGSAAPLSEVARVFGLTPAEAGTRPRELQKAGKAATTTLAGAPHWHVA